MPRTIGKPDLQRLRVRFRKDGRLAYLGHIELLNTIMRAVRRAGLPFSVGNGFARRMRVQFCQALPVGAASLAEYYDVYLDEQVPAAQALAMLQDATPALLVPDAACYQDGWLAALEAWLTRSDWGVQIAWRDGQDATAAHDEALHALASIGTINFMRGDKPRSISLDDTLLGWDFQSGGKGQGSPMTKLLLRTRSSNLGALRPAVLLGAALEQPELSGSQVASMRVTRLGQWHEDETGRLQDPMTLEFVDYDA